MPIIKRCKVCNSEFRTKPSFVKKGLGKYCSLSCLHESQRKGKVVKCFLCDKEVYKQPKALQRSKSNKFFCSKSCQTKWRNSVFIGPKHANWIHGKYAYRSMLARNGITPVCTMCKTVDRRVLATHHIDGQRNNNNVGNLTWLCHNCHHLVHRYKGEQSRLQRFLR